MTVCSLQISAEVSAEVLINNEVVPTCYYSFLASSLTIRMVTDPIALTIDLKVFLTLAQAS